MAHPEWTLLHPRMTQAHLGYLPGFLDDADPRPAKEQFNSNYVAGWNVFKGFKLNANNSLTYPGDPALPPLATCQFRKELIVFYQSSWVAIIQPDRSFEVCRMD